MLQSFSTRRTGPPRYLHILQFLQLRIILVFLLSLFYICFVSFFHVYIYLPRCFERSQETKGFLWNRKRGTRTRPQSISIFLPLHQLNAKVDVFSLFLVNILRVCLLFFLTFLETYLCIVVQYVYECIHGRANSNFSLFIDLPLFIINFFNVRWTKNYFPSYSIDPINNI